jgi:hypothetical protein
MESVCVSAAYNFGQRTFLNWAVPADILNDVDFLSPSPGGGGLTIEDLSLGDNLSSDFLVAPPQDRMSPAMELPNGRMHLLVATAITRPEMEFALHRGKGALLARLMATPEKQTSRLNRASVV